MIKTYEEFKGERAKAIAMSVYAVEMLGISRYQMESVERILNRLFNRAIEINAEYTQTFRLSDQTNVNTETDMAQSVNFPLA